MLTKRLMLVVAGLIVVLAAGCSVRTEPHGDESRASSSQADPSERTLSTSNSDVESDDSSTESAETEFPIAAAITELAGFSEIDVATAVNNARFESIVDCMTTEGWDFDYEDLPEAGPTEEPIAYFGSQIQYYLDQIAAMEAGTEGATGSDANTDRPVEFEKDEFECWVQAENQYPNPLQSLWAWLAKETQDLETRVNQDPRLVAVREESAKCIASSGYDVASIEEAANHFNGLATQVWEDLQAGKVAPNEARAKLLSLSKEVAAAEEHVRSCAAPVAEMETEVRGELEEEFLRENGDRIALIAEDYAGLLNSYQEFLDEAS